MKALYQQMLKKIHNRQNPENKQQQQKLKKHKTYLPKLI